MKTSTMYTLGGVLAALLVAAVAWQYFGASSNDEPTEPTPTKDPDEGKTTSDYLSDLWGTVEDAIEWGKGIFGEGG